MKKQLVYLFLLLSIGLLVIITQNISHNSKKGNEVKQIRDNEKILLEPSLDDSSVENIDIPDNEREPEIYNTQQMYFDNAQALYSFFLFGEVEDIKYEVQKYIQGFIDKNILDCSIISDSIEEADSKINFKIQIEGDKDIKIEVVRDNNNKIIDIIIYQ